MDSKKLLFPRPFSKRKMKCAWTFGLCASATFSESADLLCACHIFRHKKLAYPTRYDFERRSCTAGFESATLPLSQNKSHRCWRVCLRLPPLNFVLLMRNDGMFKSDCAAFSCKFLCFTYSAFTFTYLFLFCPLLRLLLPPRTVSFKRN